MIFHNTKLINLGETEVSCRVNQQVQNYKTCLKNSRFGVEKFNFSLGLSRRCISFVSFCYLAAMFVVVANGMKEDNIK